MTPDEFASRCDKASRQFTGSKVGVNAAAEYVARAVRASVAVDAGPDRTLSGTTRGKHRSLPLTVRVQKAADTDKPKAVVAGKPGGQWSWLESGTKAHIVGAGRGAVGVALAGRTARVTKVTKAGKYSTRTVKRKVLKIGGRFVTGPFMAGGSPAKHTFSRAVNAAEPQVARIMAKATTASTVKALAGR